tara:strand:+ start:2248 stop:3441 length:1194 start_codon:yes stop_codon:yes gene_type:complete
MNLKTKKKDLVILAGGKGTRIKNYLNGKPKPMIKIKDIPFLSFIINHFSKFDLNKIYIMAGYRGGVIKKKYHGKIVNFTKIECLIEKKPLDTFGCLKLIKNKLNDFYIVNGDTFFDVSLENLKIQSDKIGLMTLTKNLNYPSNNKLSNLKMNKKKEILYKKKSNLMNGGLYFFKKEILNYLNNKSQSLENDIIPLLINKNRISGEFIKDKKFLDIGTKKNLQLIKKNYKYFFEKFAVFLDRDGVINYDKGYTHKIKDFKFKTGVLQGLKKLYNKNYEIFIVTNQAGIAKGKYKIQDFVKLQKFIKTTLAKKNIFISDVKYCPFHPMAKIKKFRKRSNYRKPGNLMIKSIIKDRLINLNKSFMIGDKISDFKCASKSGIKFYYTQKNFKQLILSIIRN